MTDSVRKQRAPGGTGSLGQCAYSLVMTDPSGQIIESVDLTRPEFVTFKADLLQARRLLEDQALREAVLGFVQQCAERKDDIGVVCRELLRAHSAGEDERAAELARPIAVLIQVTAEGRAANRTAADAHVRVEMTPELQRQIAVLANDILGRRRKRPHRSARGASKRSA